MTSWEFPGSEPIDIFINIASGSVAVSGEPTDATTVLLERQRPAAVTLLLAGGQRHLQRRAPGDRAAQEPARLGCAATPAWTSRSRPRPAPAARCGRPRPTCPAWASWPSWRPRTASGDVTAASVSGPAADQRTANGDVWLERAGATAAVSTASGDVQLRRAGGDVSVHTASGDVAHRPAPRARSRVQTASGDIQIGSAAAGEVERQDRVGRHAGRRRAGRRGLPGPVQPDRQHQQPARGDRRRRAASACRSAAAASAATSGSPGPTRSPRRSPRGSSPPATQLPDYRQGDDHAPDLTSRSARSTWPTCTGPPTSRLAAQPPGTGARRRPPGRDAPARSGTGPAGRWSTSGLRLVPAQMADTAADRSGRARRPPRRASGHPARRPRR